MSEATARAYYDAIDGDDYEAFADLLAPEVVHRRPDRTIEGRETLVEFMREGRPSKDTSHELRRVYGESGAGQEVVAEGRLLDADGNQMFAFADCFEVENEKIVEIRTYTR